MPIRLPAAPLRAVLFAAGCSLLAALPARAELPDEIQVYDDSSNPHGKFGLELHVNATPSGRGIPDYPGEITPVHGIRTTLEPSYGLTDHIELGGYLPFDHLPDGTERFAGPRLRIKLIGQKGTNASPFFCGINFELSDVRPAFERNQNQLEIRPILGWRTPEWLLSINPVVDLPLKPGERTGGPDFAPSFKVGRTVADGVQAGVEYYTDLGQFSSLLPYSKESHTLFLALDVDSGPLPFNVGIGRGLTSSADHWTIKAIFDLPI